MKNLILALNLLVISGSCAIIKKTEIKDAELMRIDGKITKAEEFLYVYEKNNFNNDSIYTEQDVDEYFDLFVNFKLKVAEAKRECIDDSQTFIKEYETYKKQLIKPYLLETKEQEKLVKAAYERLKYEIDASHILVTLKPGANPKDTTNAYERILKLREKACAGENFSELAYNFSEDPSAKVNKGRLGYFTAFQMVYQFEDAAYNTPVDSMSEIIKTKFGYHILKVHDRRPNSGKVKVSHIMLSSSSGSVDEASRRNKIFEIHEQLEGGADWDELCRKFSDDQRTKNNGGTLPFIGLRQINDTEIEQAAFNLQNIGQISDPVRSRFGWHILKLEEKRGLEPFKDLKDDLKQKVSKDDRSKISRQAVIAKLKKDHNFYENITARNQIVELADSSLIKGEWDSQENQFKGEYVFFTVNDEVYKVEEVIEYISKEQKSRSGLSPQNYMNELIDNYIGRCLYEVEEKSLLTRNSNFRLLLNEYYEGILLFEIMNQKVWNKAVKDTLGLRKFFNSNRDSYYWEERAKASIFRSPNIKTIEQVKSDQEKPFFEIMEVEIDTTNEIINNIQLDTLARLFDRYDPSFLILEVNLELFETDKYAQLKSYLKDLGLAPENIIEEIDSIGDIILVKLNSKSKKSLEYLYNRETALNLHVSEESFERGDCEIIDSLEWKTGYYEFQKDNEYFLVVIEEILNAEPKKLKDVKGLVISDYQNYLEQNWLKELKGKYKVEINDIVLEKIKKSYRKRINSTG